MDKSLKNLLRAYTKSKWPDLECVNVSAFRHKSYGRIEWQVAINAADYIKKDADLMEVLAWFYEKWDSQVIIKPGPAYIEDDRHM